MTTESAVMQAVRRCIPANASIYRPEKVTRIFIVLSFVTGMLLGISVHAIYSDVTRQDIRLWSEIKDEEKARIVAEAEVLFPHVKYIGDRVSWKAVTVWLVEKKRVAHTNPRDLFRHYAD